MYHSVFSPKVAKSNKKPKIKPVAVKTTQETSPVPAQVVQSKSVKAKEVPSADAKIEPTLAPSVQGKAASKAKAKDVSSAATPQVKSESTPVKTKTKSESTPVKMKTKSESTPAKTKTSRTTPVKPESKNKNAKFVAPERGTPRRKDSREVRTPQPSPRVSPFIGSVMSKEASAQMRGMFPDIDALEKRLRAKPECEQLTEEEFMTVVKKLRPKVPKLCFSFAEFPFNAWTLVL